LKTSRPRALGAAAVILAVAVPAIAGAQGVRDTRIVSPPAGGAPADGGSDNVTFSQDARRVEMMAYDSGATNLVGGDTNGVRDIFLFRRGAAEGDLNGSLERVSVSSSGAQGNGDSTNPAIDGDQRRRPHCVVFESRATNLDRADRSPDSDIYLRDTRRRRTTLVSPRLTDARNPVVDGECELVTFEARGRIYVRDLVNRKTARLAGGTNPDQQTNGKGVAYERGGQIRHQQFFVKFRSKKKGGPVVVKKGRELLVSAAGSGAPGNGVSSNPSADDNGFYVAFESTATNLCTGVCTGVSEDRNGAVSDVFRRTIDPRRAPTSDRMQMVSYSHAVDAQGDGPSNNPAMTGAGENIVFDSEAANLRESTGIQLADPNGAIRDIYYWNFPRGRKTGNVSRESRSSAERATGQAYNGGSIKPAASNRANYVGFLSVQAGDHGEANGPLIPDAFIRFLGGE